DQDTATRPCHGSRPWANKSVSSVPLSSNLESVGEGGADTTRGSILNLSAVTVLATFLHTVPLKVQQNQLIVGKLWLAPLFRCWF
ncbi:hypothetical protein, partial [Salmonella sp. gx-f7]|uniref:hypothetical protein n=1 Tax=Salmonella sp. gx-f7 TaxID=2582606 RepID=UPI001F27B55B